MDEVNSWVNSWAVGQVNKWETDKVKNLAIDTMMDTMMDSIRTPRLLYRFSKKEIDEHDFAA